MLGVLFYRKHNKEASVAQPAARESHNLEVLGSIPNRSKLFFPFESLCDRKKYWRIGFRDYLSSKIGVFVFLHKATIQTTRHKTSQKVA